MKNFILGLFFISLTAFEANGQTYYGSFDRFTVNSGWNVSPGSTTTSINFTVRVNRELGSTGNWNWLPFNMNVKVGLVLAPGSALIEYLSPVYNISSSNFGTHDAFHDATFSFSVPSSKLLHEHNLVLFTNIPSGGSTTYTQEWGYPVKINNPPPAPPGPANDNYTGAINLTSTAIAGTTVNATQSSQAAPSCDVSIDDDVWYKFVATSTSHTINLNNVQFYGTSYGTPYAAIAIYNSSLGYMQCEAGNYTYTVSALIIGQTYYVRLWTTSTTNRRMTFDISVTTSNINSITNIIRNGYSYEFTATFSHDSAIPISDITFEWGLFSPDEEGIESWGFSIIPGNSPNHVYVEGTAGDTAILLGVRMKRISTNTYISDWYIRNGMIWWG